MGRGGAGGGSSRSSGGGGFSGGSRSSGGFSGGGYSSHRGGYGSSHPTSSSSHSYNSGYHHHHDTVHVYHHDDYGYGPRYSREYHHHYHRETKLSHILTTLIAIFIIVLAIGIAVKGFGFSSGGGSGITRSTVQREPLEKQYVTTTDYYTDNAGWISSPAKLKEGMKHFYDKTGVQPYLYITETIDGVAHPNDTQMRVFAEALYDELFEDEGHLLLVFQEYGSDSQYKCWTVAGKMAKTVFDDEARGILADYIDHYYYSDMTEDQFFSESFAKTADRMMTVTKSPLPKIIISIVILIGLVVMFTWWKKAKEQKNIEAEHTEKILNADLGSKFGSSDTEELENKYKD